MRNKDGSGASIKREEKLVDIFIRVLTAVFISGIVEILVSGNISRWREKEAKDNRVAAEKREVTLNRQMKKLFVCMAVFLLIAGLALAIFPQICGFFGFNYKIVLPILWIPLIFDFTMLAFMLVRIEYTESGFKYINAFGFKKVFGYDDVIEIIDKGKNVRVITKSKKILLFNAFSGVRSFTAYIRERNANVGS